MLKRFLAIAAVVLIANVAALQTVVRNGLGAADTVITMTERELRLVNAGSDTTGMTLRFEWQRDRPRGPMVADPALAWFDRAKLRSIGFDCSVEPTAATAQAYYSGPAVMPRATYVVFEYDPHLAPAQEGSGQTGKIEYPPRLKPVDVGNDARALRARHPDVHRYLLTAAVVRLRLIAATASQPARLEGAIFQVLPGEVYVPDSMQALIASVVGRTERDAPWLALSHPPRYEVTLQYGSRLLPRVAAVRPLVPPR